MKLSAGQGARNRPWRDIVVGVVTLLTVAGSLALPAPALARKSADWFWGDVFGHPSRPHRIRHAARVRSEEHTSELQSHVNLVCRLLLEKKNPHGLGEGRQHGHLGDVVPPTVLG